MPDVSSDADERNVFEEGGGIPVLDSVSTALWKSMQVAGDDPARIKGWGQLFNV